MTLVILHIPGGRIDHAHHYNNPYRALDETLVLDDAVTTVLSMVDLTDTLLVLTSDHSHVMTMGGLATPRGNPVLGMTSQTIMIKKINKITMFCYEMRLAKIPKNVNIK